MFQQAENYYDLTTLCISSTGLILVISYIASASLVMHNGDFYRIRRWKASICFAVIPTGVASAVLTYYSIAERISTLSSKSTLAVGGAIIASVMLPLTLAIPFLFIVTLGVHHQLKWWLNSNDYLDKIWKDPNKAHKSVIQKL